jgi:cyclophilin family peptidyl-prolyl cis-trans isomerase
MKKISKIFFSCLLAVVLLFSFTACAEVDKGSKIQRMKIELEFLDASGAVVDTQTAELKLYLNFAPKTCEHFMQLAADGYYDGVTISHVSSSWCEFGGYTMGDDGKLVKKEYNYDNLEGEFKNNGLGGTKLTTIEGALIMKRSYDNQDGTDNSPKYDTAQASVIVTFTSTSKFDPDNYCVFGLLETTDGDTYYSTTADEDLDRSSLSSAGKFSSIARLEKNSDGNKTYYFEKYEEITEDSDYYAIKSDYYSLIYDSEGNKHYYKGTSAIAENELEDEDLDSFTKLLNEKSNYFLTIPYTQVRIKTITKA